MMLPIDEDILATRYHDDPRGAHWYRTAREMGADPGEAMRAVGNLRSVALPNPTQIEALQRYAAACGAAIDVLVDLANFAPLGQGFAEAVAEWAAPDDVAGFRREPADSAADAHRIAQLVNERLHP
jgi:hypothetical protein